MRFAPAVTACVLLCAACVPARTSQGGATPSAASAAGVQVEAAALPTAVAPRFWFDVDREVVVVGRVPSIHFVIEGVNLTSGTWLVRPRRVLGPDSKPIEGPCDDARRPEGRWNDGTIDLRCFPMTRAGRYVVELDLAAHGWGNEVVELPLRVIDAPPAPRPVPPEWASVSLAAETPKTDCVNSRDYEPALEGGNVVLREARRSRDEFFPPALLDRLDNHAAANPRYLSEWPDGFFLMADRGEWGGGLTWLPRAQGDAVDIPIALPDEHDSAWPQNVQRAQRVGDKLYLLQGLAHGGFDEGQLAAVWRERGRFRTHVIARYSSEPVDWERMDDGRWLVATWNALWISSESGTSELVTRLPDIVEYPDSLVRRPDGVFLIGTREGVLRLTPTWEDTPRYAAELLIPQERRDHLCEGLNDGREQ